MEQLPNINEETINLIIKGDLTAFNNVIKNFQKAIFNHLYRMTGSPEDAADLTQDTFFKLYKKRQLIDPKQNFKAWLYKIATNTAYEWFNKKKRRNEVLLSVEECEFETIEQNLPYYYIDNANIIDLEIALKKARKEYQTVIFLYYQQGFTYQEMSNIMDVPLGTVKTLLYRAKKELIKELKSNG